MLGYRTTADPQTLRHGAQPWEGIVSVVCETFGCTPDVAIRQDWRLVQAILDYRNAHHARDLLNEGGRGFDALAKSPAALDILLRLHRAQAGDGVDMADVLADARRRADASERAEDA